MWGTIGKVGIHHFLRDVDAEKIRDTFGDGLEEEMNDKASADRKQAAQQFLALFDRDIKEGQEIKIRTSAEGKIDVEIGGQKKSAPTSPKLARAVWSIWLGSKSISPELRKALVDRVDVLGKP
jgi:hypothetical protein